MTGKETSPRPFLPEKMALRLVAVYALVGGIWILFSDRLLALFTAAPEAVTSANGQGMGLCCHYRPAALFPTPANPQKAPPTRR
jgi:hypothetical protein